MVEVSGEEGNFTVKVRKHPRYVDMEKCIACGVCAQKCPKKVDDEYNMGLNKRRSIHIKYGQTVPLKYAIDPKNCIYLTKGKCRACEKFCPTGAINFEDKARIVTLKVGSVILSPGFKPFDPWGIDFYGYDEIPDVVTGLEYERLLSASGPYMGHLIRPSDGKEPRKIAWIQCVGSRNINRCDNAYCSSVCCTYAIKQALMTAEHLSGESVEQTIFYMDIRTIWKEVERYYEGAREGGVRFVKARPHSIMGGPNNIGVRLLYTSEAGEQFNEDFDMVVLSIGLEAPADALKLAETFDIDLNPYHFVKTSCFDPVASSRPGVYVAGDFQTPKAIPRTVIEASAAAANASHRLVQARGSLTKIKTYPPEMETAAEAPRVGVFVCSCGINIANVVDVAQVTDYAKTLPNVVFAENNLFTCSTDTQVLIAQKIKEHRLNRIVVAACTPRTHEPLFQDTLRDAGLNPYLFEMANIRNHNSWVHQKMPEKATAKAKDQVRMAVAKAARNCSLDPMKVQVVQKALVIGGGFSGMTAALGLADQGYETVLVEKSDTLGGNAWHLNETWKGEDIRPRLKEMIARVENHEKINVLKNSRVVSCSGSVGNFVSEVEVDGQPRQISYGIAVLCAGGKEYKPDEYLYGEDDRVMTHLEFDKLLREREEDAAKADTAVFIQCVGSRVPERLYCSRLCCTHSVQSAIRLKTLNPEMNVFILNRDIRTYGDREELYTKARELGVIFIKYYRDRKPEVSKDGKELLVTVFDPISQRNIAVSTDYLILAAAIVPNDTRDLVEMYKCSTNEDGFLNEAHPKLRPVDMSVEGLFVAGLCNYPKPVDESIVQSKAAVSRAGVILSKAEMQLDAVKSYVTENCDGCALCLDVCPYRAIALETYSRNGHSHRRIKTDSALCKGCGLCEATCPKGGVFVHGFTLDQLESQVDAILEAA